MARMGRTRGRHGARQGLSGLALLYALCLGLMIGRFAPDWIARFDRSQAVPMRQAPTADRLSADFALCHHGGGTNCVVDGDTFWFRGDKYRIADIDTPETHGPRCAAEGELGSMATRRLQALMNAGPFFTGKYGAGQRSLWPPVADRGARRPVDRRPAGCGRTGATLGWRAASLVLMANGKRGRCRPLSFIFTGS